jgi:two-component system, NarL family, response regulator NreC
MHRLRILLADDHKVMREGLRLLINAQPDMEVIGVADNGRSAILESQALHPDLVIMDVTMPELNGLKATQQLCQVCPGAKIMALTRHSDNGYLQQMLAAGATGYALKQSAPEELIRGIRTVIAGHKYLDPALTNQLVGTVFGKSPSRRLPPENSLSQREEEVLRLIAWGFLNKEIGAQLQISVKTAEAHKANAMQKMGMKSRIDIVRYALLRGWMENV